TRARLAAPDLLALHRELQVQQADDTDPAGETTSDVLDPVELLVRERGRRDLARRVPRVDAGLFDVLHHGADEDIHPVTDGVHVDLDRAFEEPVDQHGVLAAPPRARGGDRPHTGCRRARPATTVPR